MLLQQVSRTINNISNYQPVPQKRVGTRSVRVEYKLTLTLVPTLRQSEQPRP